MPPETVDKLMFIDESGVKTNLVLRYGRAMGGARVVDHAPVNTPTNTTVISGMTTTGPVAYATWSGGTQKDQLTEQVRDTLIPAMEPGQIVVWDNLRAHHSKEIVELLENAGITEIYTPPYSPDMNPIGMMWPKMKEILRTMRIHVVEKLVETVRTILSEQIFPENCQGWFRKDGYIPWNVEYTYSDRSTFCVSNHTHCSRLTCCQCPTGF